METALAAGIDRSEPVIAQAEAALVSLHERAQQEEAQEKRDDESRRQRAVDNELARQAAAALLEAEKLKARALEPEAALSGKATRGGTGVAFEEDDDDDEEGEGDLNDERERESNLPRKLARRKSKRYSFSQTVKASREELHKVFIAYGGAAQARGRVSSVGTAPSPVSGAMASASADADEEEELGFINAMQFSNIWRLITEEKGNLFKEMQVSRLGLGLGLGLGNAGEPLYYMHVPNRLDMIYARYLSFQQMPVGLGLVGLGLPCLRVLPFQQMLVATFVLLLP